MPFDMYGLLATVTIETCRYLQRLLPTLAPDWWRTCVACALTPQQAKFVMSNSVSTLDVLDLAALLRVLDYNWHLIRETEGLSAEGIRA